MLISHLKFKISQIEVFQLFLILCSFLFLILIILVRQQPYFGTDLAISQYLQGFQEVPFIWLMNTLSYLGTFLPFTALCITTFWLLKLHKLPKAAAYSAISVIGSVLISLTFKLLVGRPRPDGNLVHQVNQFYYPDSFPSQHVLEFIGLFGFLLFISFTKIHPKTTRYLVSFLPFFFIATIGLSRIYLGAHWFTDVLGSYLVGFVWLAFVIYLYRRPN